MTNNAENRQALRKALQSRKNSPKVAVEVPAEGTICHVSFCADEASHFDYERATCHTHHRAYAEVS